MNPQQFDLNSALNRFLDSDHASSSCQDLEDLLSEIERESKGMHFFLEILINTNLWKSWKINPNPYQSMILTIGSEIDRIASKGNEPAFHSKKHMMDVCLMLSYLLKQEERAEESGVLTQAWKISSLEKWQLLLAAAAHDLGHPGLMNSVPFEIEQQSLDLLATLLLRAGNDAAMIQEVLETIKPWILATDHGQYKELLERVRSQSPMHADCLAMLLVESDLASSVLPIRGKLLTDRLCEEWAGPYPEKSIALRNQLGYLNFLTSLHFLSPHSVCAGITTILDNSISQLHAQMS